MHPLIEVRDLVFRYGESDFFLAIPELTLDKGRRYAFVGPSGCGKTTLIYLIAGIYQPERGTLTVQGENIAGQNDAQRRSFRSTKIGFIFQEFELLDYLTVRENILLPNFLNPVLGRTKDHDGAVQKLADSMGMGDKLGRYPEQLSQGEKQRVAICRALINNPDIIIADEPTGNLDPKTTAIIMALIQEQVRLRGCTFLMVTHDHSLLGGFDQVIDFQQFAKSSAKDIAA